MAISNASIEIIQTVVRLMSVNYSEYARFLSFLFEILKMRYGKVWNSLKKFCGDSGIIFFSPHFKVLTSKIEKMSQQLEQAFTSCIERTFKCVIRETSVQERH